MYDIFPASLEGYRKLFSLNKSFQLVYTTAEITEIETTLLKSDIYFIVLNVHLSQFSEKKKLNKIIKLHKKINKKYQQIEIILIAEEEIFEDLSNISELANSSIILKNSHDNYIDLPATIINLHKHDRTEQINISHDLINILN